MACLSQKQRGPKIMHSKRPKCWPFMFIWCSETAQCRDLQEIEMRNRNYLLKVFPLHSSGWPKNPFKLGSKALSRHSLNRWWRCSDCFTHCPCTHLHILSKPFGATDSMTLAASPLPLVPIVTARTSRTETELKAEDWGDLYWVVDDGTAQGRFILCDSFPWQDYRNSGSCWGANMYPLHWDVGRWWLNCFSHKALTNYRTSGVLRVLVPVLWILTEIFCKCGFFP